MIGGRDLERRELVGKARREGLFDLATRADGSYRCYACTMCERVCPVDCISLEYCPEFPEEPFDSGGARAAAAAPGGAARVAPGGDSGAAAAGVESPAAPQPPVDMTKFDPVIAGLRAGTGLIQALHATQDAFGYLPRVALESLAEEAGMPLSRVYGVASFYGQFRLSPVGRHMIQVCMGTACHVAGAPLVAEAFSQDLEIPVGGTTPDGLFSLHTVNCLGACALAPVVSVGADTLGRVGPNEARRLVRKLRRQQEAS